MLTNEQHARVVRVQRYVRLGAMLLFIGGISTILYACGVFSEVHGWVLSVVRVLVGLCGVLAIILTPYLLVYAKWYRPRFYKRRRRVM